MKRYRVWADADYQYLGGVGQYDVIYWKADANGHPRLIAKYSSTAGCYYSWDFDHECWVNSYHRRAMGGIPSADETATILTMYECFAIKS